ncbi:MAG: DUF4355 domain-containing protein [Oscillospiraceae bacterium]|nr:DUF4355 domain-containing protein [Oscillospiraceae bacterium]
MDKTIQPPQSTEPAAEKSFTQEDIDAAVSKAVAEAQGKWKAEQDQAARLAKLSAQEREKEQLKIDRENFNKERDALNREKLEMEAAKQLKAAGVPESFAAQVTGATADETKANIDAFAKEWNAAVGAGVDERLKGKPPKSSPLAPPSTMADTIAKSIKQGF